MLAVTCDVILLPIFIAFLCSLSFFFSVLFFLEDKVNTHSHTALNFILLAKEGKEIGVFQGWKSIFGAV